jgi:hypothetical protein
VDDDKFGVDKMDNPPLSKEEKPADEPTVDSDEAPDMTDDELLFEAGHKRMLLNGTSLTVKAPSVRGKYLVDIFLPLGGHLPKEMTAQAISKWGSPVSGEKTEEKEETSSVAEATEPTVESAAVADDSSDAKSEATEPTVESTAVADTEPVAAPVRELKVVPFVIRDADGFHAQQASRVLNKYVAEGWREHHVQYETVWVPARDVKSSSHVETVVYWTLVRMNRG